VKIHYAFFNEIIRSRIKKIAFEFPVNYLEMLKTWSFGEFKVGQRLALAALG
jgi:hypothetical protein